MAGSLWMMDDGQWLMATCMGTIKEKDVFAFSFPIGGTVGRGTEWLGAKTLKFGRWEIPASAAVKVWKSNQLNSRVRNYRFSLCCLDYFIHRQSHSISSRNHLRISDSFAKTPFRGSENNKRINHLALHAKIPAVACLRIRQGNGHSSTRRPNMRFNVMRHGTASI